MFIKWLPLNKDDHYFQSIVSHIMFPIIGSSILSDGWLSTGADCYYLLHRTTLEIDGSLYWTVMTSSNLNIFRVAGHLWGASTSHRWFPLTRLVIRSFNVSSVVGWATKREAYDETPSRSWWRHCNVLFTHWPLADVAVILNVQFAQFIDRILCIALCKVAHMRMSQNVTNGKSTLVQVLSWCRQATSLYLR